MLGWDGPEKIEHSGQIESKVTVLTGERLKQLAEKKRNAVLRRMAGAQAGVN
jgi:hypothetical protein